MATCIRRRELIAVLGGTAVAWPLAVRAQQSKRIPRIGVLLFGTPDTDPNLPAFLRGLRELRSLKGRISQSSIVMRRVSRTDCAGLR